MIGCGASRGRLRADCIWFAVPHATEWQRIRNQINAAMILARSDFVNVLSVSHHAQPAVSTWIADAHRGGKRFIVRADEKLTAFLELKGAIPM